MAGGVALPVFSSRIHRGHTRFRRPPAAAEKVLARGSHRLRDRRARGARLSARGSARFLYLCFRFLFMRAAIQYLHRMPRRKARHHLLHQQPAAGRSGRIRRRKKQGRRRPAPRGRVRRHDPLFCRGRGGRQPRAGWGTTRRSSPRRRCCPPCSSSSCAGKKLPCRRQKRRKTGYGPPPDNKPCMRAPPSEDGGARVFICLPAVFF